MHLCRGATAITRSEHHLNKSVANVKSMCLLRFPSAFKGYHTQRSFSDLHSKTLRAKIATNASCMCNRVMYVCLSSDPTTGQADAKSSLQPPPPRC